MNEEHVTKKDLQKDLQKLGKNFQHALQRTESVLRQDLASKKDLSNMGKELRAEIRDTVSQSTQEICEMIQFYASHVDARFNEQDKRFDRIEATMVTKDYLDKKIAEVRGDYTIMIRKEDTKVNRVVTTLARSKVITKKSAEQLRSMGPFPPKPKVSR